MMKIYPLPTDEIFDLPFTFANWIYAKNVDTDAAVIGTSAKLELFQLSLK